jgi:hypothetical protein
MTLRARIRKCWFLAAFLGLIGASAAQAMEIRSIEEFLVTEGELRFPNAENLVAVVTFEDPDDTGLGDTLAFLAAKQILFEAQVGSLAVTLFQQGLAPDESGLGYYEKVDRLTAGHGFVAALWGHIARERQEIVVDTYLQLFADRQDRSRFFDHEFRFAAFEKPLRAGVEPSRVWVQTVHLPLSYGETINAIADSVRTLRSGPSVDAPPVPGGFLGEGAAYRVLDREANWTQLVLMESGIDGWTSVTAHCSPDSRCGSVLRSAAFLNGLLRYANGRADDVPALEGLQPSARAISSQIDVIETLYGSHRDRGKLIEAIDESRIWSESRSVPGGAAFANFEALARLTYLQATDELNAQTVRGVADRLARASLEYPGNLDVLHNLAVLFQFLEDENRSRLAQRLYDEQVTRARQ